MGKASRRKHLVIVPDKYWVSSIPNIKWVVRESSAKKT
jgi:hypothetical protein